jgi:hypothetical protein
MNRRRARHGETVHDEELTGVMHPCAQRGSEVVAISEVDADGPACIAFDSRLGLIGVDALYQVLNGKWKHTATTQCRNAMYARVTFKLLISGLHLRPTLWRDVPGLLGGDTDLCPIR